MNRRSTGLAARSLALALLATVVTMSASASGKKHQDKGSDNRARVVAHIPFSGLTVVDMSMQKKGNDKFYLYVQHSREQGISIVDISKPAQAKALGVTPWPDPARSSRMNMTGNLAIIAESEVLPTHSGEANDDLVLWDMSEPTAPRVVQKFSGVIKWLQDERNFIYVLNGEGLWIVSEPADRQSDQAESASSYGG